MSRPENETPISYFQAVRIKLPHLSLRQPQISANKGVFKTLKFNSRAQKKIGKFTLHQMPKIKWTENIEKCQVFLIFAFLSINFVYFYKLSHIPFDSLLKWPNCIILAFLGVCLAKEVDY